MEGAAPNGDASRCGALRRPAVGILVGWLDASGKREATTPAPWAAACGGAGEMEDARATSTELTRSSLPSTPGSAFPTPALLLCGGVTCSSRRRADERPAAPPLPLPVLEADAVPARGRSPSASSRRSCGDWFTVSTAKALISATMGLDSELLPTDCVQLSAAEAAEAERAGTDTSLKPLVIADRALAISTLGYLTGVLSCIAGKGAASSPAGDSKGAVCAAAVALAITSGALTLACRAGASAAALGVLLTERTNAPSLLRASSRNGLARVVVVAPGRDS